MIGAVASLVPQVAQSSAQAEDAAVLAQYHFLQQLRLNAEQHELKLRAKATMFKEGASLDRQLHLRTMAHELNIARREGVRDVWKARNDTAQTLMIVESVFLAFIFEIIVGARIPEDTSEGVLFAFSALLGLSVALSMVGIILLLAQHHRLAQFDFTRQGPCELCGITHGDLNDFFDEHCLTIDNCGRAFFSAAVSCALLTCCVYGTSKWMSHFGGDVVPGVLFCVPLGLTVVFVTFSALIVPEDTVAPDSDQPMDAGVSFVRPGQQPFAGEAQDKEPATAASDGATPQTRSRGASTKEAGDGHDGGSSQPLSRRGSGRHHDFGGLRAEAEEVQRMLRESFCVRPGAAAASRVAATQQDAGDHAAVPAWRGDLPASERQLSSEGATGEDDDDSDEEVMGASSAGFISVPDLEVEAPSRAPSEPPQSGRHREHDLDSSFASPNRGPAAGVDASGIAARRRWKSAARDALRMSSSFASASGGSAASPGAPPPSTRRAHREQQHTHSALTAARLLSGTEAVHDDDIDRALMDLDTIDVGDDWGDLPGAAGAQHGVAEFGSGAFHQHHWTGFDAVAHEMRMLSVSSAPPSRDRSPNASGPPTPPPPPEQTQQVATPTKYLQAPGNVPIRRRQRSRSAASADSRRREMRRPGSGSSVGDRTPPPEDLSPLVPSHRGSDLDVDSGADTRSAPSSDAGFYTPRSFDDDRTAEDGDRRAPF